MDIILDWYVFSNSVFREFAKTCVLFRCFNIFGHLGWFHYVFAHASNIYGHWQWPYRGICIGEAAHPGLPIRRVMQLYGEDEEDDNEKLFSTIALATQVVQSIEARVNGTIPLDHADHPASCVDDDTQVDSVMVDPTPLGLGGLHVGPDFEFLVSPVASVPVPCGFPTPLGPPPLSPIDVDPAPVVISLVLGFCGEAAQLHPFSGPEGTHSPAFLDALLEKLRLLPVVGTVPTYNFNTKIFDSSVRKISSGCSQIVV